ncbi:MAG: formylglycine-generating enzyme family protein [Cyanobacteriota bacterium]
MEPPISPPSPTAQRATVSGRRTVPFLLRQPRETRGFREALDDDQALTMLWIPPGRFWMGSPADEEGRRESEGPRHQVQLQGFFMGQTPITQAQWRTVALWKEREGEQWGRELDPNPSYFQPREDGSEGQEVGYGSFALLEEETNADQRPVDRVSWDNAMEFCHRLSQRTSRTYTLPSEAQWEYACRAGTTTPFAFGDTLTQELANYDATVSYADGPTGGRLHQTTPVGRYPANAWGLKDMHGNVWEWCLDHWHKNYGEENNIEQEKAPDDGSAWLYSESVRNKKRRLLRGGSWGSNPRGCRSAVRNLDGPVGVNGLVGFRVVCLPQGRST